MSSVPAVNPGYGAYSLYGLRLRSTVALPCPEAGSADLPADVELVESTAEEIRAASASPPVQVINDEYWDCRRFADGSVSACWREHFDFFVSGDGARVLWRRLTRVSDEVLFTYLLNQVLSYCMVARGTEPLHATAVVVDGEAIAILGDSGYGKSTLAAALMRRGYPLLTDDVLAVEFAEDRVLAHASLARLKLEAASIGLEHRGRKALPMNAFTTKMILPLKLTEHVSHAVPLRAIYVIPSSAGTAKIAIRRASGRRALLALVKNTFNATFFDQRRLQQQFRFAGRLAQAIPVRLLSFPRRFDMLPEVVDALLRSATRSPWSR